MNTSLWSQAAEFCAVLTLGIMLAVALHFHQRIVKQAKISGALLWVIDFMIWPVLTACVFVSFLVINQGDVKFHLVLALGAGLLIYYWRLRRYSSRIIDRSAFNIMKPVRRGRRFVKNMWKHWRGSESGIPPDAEPPG
ncbi:MAG: spore cortex biosynthesis protein YabQ [Acidobacteriota bacterium]